MFVFIMLNDKLPFYLPQETGISHNRSRKISMNEEGSSRVPKPLNEPKDKSDAKRDLKMGCIFCLSKFFHEPADADPYSSSICPECKEVDASSRFKNVSSEVIQHANK